MLLLNKLENELQRLVYLKVIVPVEKHTDWVAPIVVVPKSDNSVRICCDYTQLNKCGLRAHFPIPKVEITLAKLKESKYFTKLDTNSGFYQIKLEARSQDLTTFITPFGRFKFTRFPFGISCAPEYFSAKFFKIFSGLKGVLMHIDDVLIHASTIKEHDDVLREALSRIQAEGITLNKSKCVFGAKELQFLGHVITEAGVSVDPARIEAISEFPKPSNKKELLQWLGMVNFAGRFILVMCVIEIFQ